MKPDVIQALRAHPEIGNLTPEAKQALDAK